MGLLAAILLLEPESERERGRDEQRGAEKSRDERESRGKSEKSKGQGE
jgi:hypothetical protein